MTIRACPLLLATLLGAACSPEHSRESESVQAADACKFMALSKAELPKVIAAAERGSIDSKRKLWHHYGCVDEEEAAVWEGRLIEANDPDALLYRSSTLDLQASRLADKDPRKLAMLREAQVLEARGRRARGDGVMHIEINGKEAAVPYSSKPNEGTKRLAKEIERLSAKRSE